MKSYHRLAIAATLALSAAVFSGPANAGAPTKPGTYTISFTGFCDTMVVTLEADKTTLNALHGSCEGAPTSGTADGFVATENKKIIQPLTGKNWSLDDTVYAQEFGLPNFVDIFNLDLGHKTFGYYQDNGSGLVDHANGAITWNYTPPGAKAPAPKSLGTKAIGQP
jgi:hypothetical protein